MIPPEAILEVSATMIVGILFVVTLAKAMDWMVGRIMFSFCLFGVVPFSIAAILALLELNEASKWACIIAFGLFASFLTLAAFVGATEKEE